MNRCLLRSPILLLFVLAFSLTSHADDVDRQAEVAKRGADVMPFSHTATMHVFTKTTDGGTMSLITKDAADEQQIRMVRAHLQDMQGRFQKGDYSGPSHIHGDDMPGLAQLKAAKPGEIKVSYREVPAGAELHYRTADARLITALHDWIDAQLSDHGKDAMPGHQQQADTPKQ
jgi:hypothetical protein